MKKMPKDMPVINRIININININIKLSWFIFQKPYKFIANKLTTFSATFTGSITRSPQIIRTKIKNA